ncbi:hypothetical protein [Alienimonas chondri]|nr:hypothetical protein [Alienimonas chondri]
MLRLYEIDQRSPNFSRASGHAELLGVPLGLSWMWGDSGLGSWWVYKVSVWWLIGPLPLWSGLNLWRWTRRSG